MYDYKLGIVGAGNMASAILNGILRTGVVSPEKIVVSDIDDKKLEIIKNQGVNTVKDNKVLFKNAEFIILAVKPQVAKVIFRDIEKIENLEALTNLKTLYLVHNKISKIENLEEVCCCCCGGYNRSC